MSKTASSVAQLAKWYWDDRNLDGLTGLCSSEQGAHEPAALHFGGLAYHASGDRRRAIECWRSAMALKPSYHPPIRALAYEMNDQEDFIDAAELFQTLMRLGKATADDLTTLGEIRIKQDRLGEARQLLERALELDPRNALACLGLATAYAHMRDRAAVLSWLHKAAETEEVDLTDLDSDPVFQFLWGDREFDRILRGK